MNFWYFGVCVQSHGFSVIKSNIKSTKNWFTKFSNSDFFLYFGVCQRRPSIEPRLWHRRKKRGHRLRVIPASFFNGFVPILGSFLRSCGGCWWKISSPIFAYIYIYFGVGCRQLVLKTCQGMGCRQCVLKHILEWFASIWTKSCYGVVSQVSKNMHTPPHTPPNLTSIPCSGAIVAHSDESILWPKCSISI